MAINWIALFSQTGSEIGKLSVILKYNPTLIVSNNFEDELRYHPLIRELKVPLMMSHHDGLMKYFRAQNVYDRNNTIITLHGYLRILPEDICNQYEIYNGHPSPIDLYPELKGKDPQERVWNEREKYTIIGSVVHRVVPEVDAGEIKSRVYKVQSTRTKDELYTELKSTSLCAWEVFMKERLCVSG